ncbi:hypothetical protein CHCC20335_2871 [Bacillus paralicheniformis]|nr:hypothetical protein CHCC20335_2871 [Bacillus paralicheniformis]
MKKCCLILCLCFLLAGCSTYKPKPKGMTDAGRAVEISACGVPHDIDILKNPIL